jgi:hypothetical protein
LFGGRVVITGGFNANGEGMASSEIIEIGL